MAGERTLDVIVKALDTASLRQRVIANNLANVNTPGFKRSEVRFEDRLRKAVQEGQKLPLARTRVGHLTGRPALAEVLPVIEREESTSQRLDGNNVDVDKEMVAMADNQLSYQAAIQFLNARLSWLRQAISEGRR